MNNKAGLLLMLAFEIGRNFEQLYMSLDLYNPVNFNDLYFAIEKGHEYRDIDLSKIDGVFKTKIATDIEKRKYRRLIYLKKELNKLIDISNQEGI